MNISIKNTSNNTIISNVDQAKLKREIMGVDKIICKHKSMSYIDIEIGSYVNYLGTFKYKLNRPATVKREPGGYSYEFELEAPLYDFNDVLLKYDSTEPEFTLTGELEDFVDLIITNVNTISDFTFNKGTVPSTNFKTLVFNNVSCRKALTQLFDEFGYEWYFSNTTGLTLSYGKLENDLSALSFSFGKNEGLYELTRKNFDDKDIITRLYVRGGDKNLGSSYGQTKLCLPSADGDYLEDTTYLSKIVEAYKEFPDIFPSFTGTVTGIWPSSTSKNEKLVANSIDFDLNSYLLNGITAKVVFNTGDLMGKVFELVEYTHASKMFEIKQLTDEDGTQYPNTTIKAQFGDSFTFIDIAMPPTYITNAENALKSVGEDYLEDHCLPRYQYGLDLDDRYLNSESIDLELGDIINVIDTAIGVDVDLRITSFDFDLVEESLKVDVGNYIKKEASYGGGISLHNLDKEVNDLSIVVLNIKKDLDDYVEANPGS
jgi:hypothetical protein